MAVVGFSTGFAFTGCRMKLIPNANNVMPKTLRIIFSGKRELINVPMIMAGIEPTNSQPSK